MLSKPWCDDPSYASLITNKYHLTLGCFNGNCEVSKFAKAIFLENNVYGAPLIS